MCGCGCISCAWPASSPRSARRTCAFPSARPASCSPPDRKSTRLNSSHITISYAVFCLKKKTKKHEELEPWSDSEVQLRLKMLLILQKSLGEPESLPLFFFFNDTATTEIYTLSLHDALPIFTVTARPTEPGEADTHWQGPA